MKYAVIDIGSNSVRLLLWSDGKTLYKDLITTRLGEGLAFSSLLSAAAIDRTAKAVAHFYTYAKESGAQKIYAFATAAVRSAQNGNEFVRAVKEVCGLAIEVISGEEEAAIGLLGAVGKRDGGIIDIGGASTELTIQKDGALVYTKSLNIGAVRLFDLCGRNRGALEEIVAQTVRQYGAVTIEAPIYIIGGTAGSIAALLLGLQQYDAALVQNYIVTRSVVEELTDKLFALTPQQVAQSSCLPIKRAEIIAGGALLLLRLMEYLHLEQVTVSESDNLEGYLQRRLEE